MANATKLLESLDAGEIREQLEQLTAEQEALRVLLRAATLRDRQRQKPSREIQRSAAEGTQ